MKQLTINPKFSPAFGAVLFPSSYTFKKHWWNMVLIICAAILPTTLFIYADYSILK
ncbi:MAG: hypothetical protein ABIN97_20135 [Ginsengibacter sp.]